MEENNEAQANSIAADFSEEAKRKLEAIESLLSASDRQTYGQKLKEVAAQLGKTVRTVQRMVKKYQEQGLTAIIETERSDKGFYRISEDWQQFILKTYTDGNSGSRKMNPAQVALRVQIRAEQLGLEKYPSHMTVYRVLHPVIAKKEQKQKKRNIGWRGSRVSHRTRNGKILDVLHSNHVWQCDHTKLDIMLVDRYGKPLARP
jgi:putative transposase